MAVIDFDATQVEPAKAVEALPEGEYRVAITSSENKSTKDGRGVYLEIVLQVIDGEHKGRKVWDRLNLKNDNAQAVEIAQRTLSSICHAVRVLQPRDSVELHNLPMIARIVCEKRKDNGELSNRVKEYKPLSAASPAPAMTTGGGARRPML